MTNHREVGRTRNGEPVRVGDEVLATYGRAPRGSGRRDAGRLLRGWVRVEGAHPKRPGDFWVVDPSDGVVVATEGGAEAIRPAPKS